jgi:hypothetical protein
MFDQVEVGKDGTANGMPRDQPRTVTLLLGWLPGCGRPGIPMAPVANTAWLPPQHSMPCLVPDSVSDIGDRPSCGWPAARLWDPVRR